MTIYYLKIKFTNVWLIINYMIWEQSEINVNGRNKSGNTKQRNESLGSNKTGEQTTGV